MKKLFLLLAMVGMLAVACEPGGGVEDENGNQTEQPGNGGGNEDVIPTDKIVIKPTTIEVATEASDYVVAVSSPCSWRATTENEWITIETKLGIDGKRELIFSVADYWEIEPREGKIVVANSDEGLSAELVVTQKAFEPEWSIDVETLVFNGEAGEQTIEIVANFMGGFQATTDADWITFRYTNNSVIVRVATSNLAAQRTAEITISHNKYDLQPIKVNVVQETPSQNRVILYESSDGQIVTPLKSDGFGAKIVSNTYENGQGVILFDAPVTSIGEEAFYRCRNLASVTIPDSVTSIGRYAFNGCTSLTSVTIGNSVTSIGDYAFSGCSSLTSVTIPDSVTSIGKYAFGGCTSLTAFYGEFASSDNRCLIVDGVLYSFAPSGLTSYTIPDSVTSIGNSAFNGCTSLTSITIPDSVTSIGNFAFAYCDGLTSITIPNSVTSIGNSAFNGCTSLTSITIPDSVTSIGDSAFRSCTSLTSVTIPDSVTSIGGSAFSGCTGELIINSKIIETNFNEVTSPTWDNGGWLYGAKFTKLTIGDNITKIGMMAFRKCNTLTSVTIPNSVTSIGSYAFQYCNTLTSVTIPNSVTSIGSYAFESCNTLTNVYISDLSAWCKIDFKNYYANPLYNSDRVKLYLNDIEVTELTIPSDITEIKNYAFYNCTSLTSVTIGNSVTSIGGSAFNGCTSLTSVTIGNSVTSIGDSAFEDCSGLTGDLVIPDSVTTIGGSAFNGCTSLTSITIPDSVTSIGNFAFAFCDGLTSITIPNSVTSIGKGAFKGCTGELIVNSKKLVETDYTNSNLPMNSSDGCWLYDSKFTKLTIGNSVTSIGNSVFRGCTSLTSVTISDSVTSIGDYAFYNCTSLTSVTIPDSVTSIGKYAFSGCTSLTSLTIGNSVTSIKGGAFYHCTSLASVYCKPTTPPTGNSLMFDNKVSGRKIYVPRNSVEAYKSAQYWSGYASYIEGYDF